MSVEKFDVCTDCWWQFKAEENVEICPVCGSTEIKPFEEVFHEALTPEIVMALNEQCYSKTSASTMS